MSKGLGALETLELLKDFVLKNTKNGLDRRFIIGSCDVIKKELKALEIIKYKKVDTNFLLKTKTCEKYNDYAHWLGRKADLTQEEYDLLKEELE